MSTLIRQNFVPEKAKKNIYGKEKNVTVPVIEVKVGKSYEASNKKC